MSVISRQTVLWVGRVAFPVFYWPPACNATCFISPCLAYRWVVHSACHFQPSGRSQASCWHLGGQHGVSRLHIMHLNSCLLTKQPSPNMKSLQPSRVRPHQPMGFRRTVLVALHRHPDGISGPCFLRRRSPTRCLPQARATKMSAAIAEPLLFGAFLPDPLALRLSAVTGRRRTSSFTPLAPARLTTI